MPSPAKSEFASYVVEQMAGLGDVQAKKMFGGFGIFRMGLMFALILNDELYFKADDASVERFESRGLKAFTYEAKGKSMSLRYYQAPAEVFDDPQAMVVWAREAYACAVRNQQPKLRKSSGKASVRKRLA